MTAWIVLGAILYAWVLLRVLAGERQQRLVALRQTIESEAAARHQAESNTSKKPA